MQAISKAEFRRQFRVGDRWKTAFPGSICRGNVDTTVLPPKTVERVVTEVKPTRIKFDRSTLAFDSPFNCFRDNDKLIVKFSEDNVVTYSKIE